MSEVTEPPELRREIDEYVAEGLPAPVAPIMPHPTPHRADVQLSSPAEVDEWARRLRVKAQQVGELGLAYQAHCLIAGWSTDLWCSTPRPAAA